MGFIKKKKSNLSSRNDGTELILCLGNDIFGLFYFNSTQIFMRYIVIKLKISLPYSSYFIIIKENDMLLKDNSLSSELKYKCF